MIDTFNNKHLLSNLFDGQPQAVIWFTPVWDESKQHITDFQLCYYNEEAQSYLNCTKEQLEDLRFSKSPTVNEELRAKFFDEMVTVFKTGKRSQTIIYNPVLKKYAKILRSKIQDGILTVIQDSTEERQLLQKLEEQKAFSDSILNATLYGVFACEAVRDEHGNITDLRYIQVNDKAKKMTGKMGEEIIGKTMLDVFPDTRNNGLFDLYCRTIETGEAERLEVYYNGDGLNGWFEVSTAKFNGKGVVVTFADITSQKNAFLEIGRQKNLLDNILNHSPSGISVTQVIRDGQGNIVDGKTIMANEAAALFSGIPNEISLSKTIGNIDPTLLTSPLFKMALSALETGEPFHTQYFFEPTGRWLELSVAKMDEDHLINLFTDITIIKEAQLQLEKSIEELKRTNANLEEFTYAASHDLKEPIRKIRTFADRLKQGLLNRMDEHELLMFKRMENASQRMQLLIDDLLAYSHLSMDSSLLDEVNLNDKLKVVLGDLELPIEEKKAKIVIGPLPTVKGRRRQIQQLFQNLISNSLKYNKEDTPPEIYITSTDVKGENVVEQFSKADANTTYHLIEVKDNGIGFDQEQAEQIFKVFQRLHGKSEYSGTGIGLAIVKKVVENHNGFIIAQSEAGKGATFKILLPASV